MDPLTPISGLSIERFAEVSAEVAAARSDRQKITDCLARAGVSAEDWEKANAGWSVRLCDPVHGVTVAGPFEKHYHAALDRLLGPGPDVPPEDFAAMLGEALLAGLPAMGQNRRIDPLAWSRISYRARDGITMEPARFAQYLALAAQISERRPVAAAAGAGADQSEAAKEGRKFEQDASVAAKALGKAVVSGLGAFGSAMDAMGKSLMGPKAGDAVLVHWSDGKQYAGTVAQADKGQYLITMKDGAQHWIPEAFVKPA